MTTAYQAGSASLAAMSLLMGALKSPHASGSGEVLRSAMKTVKTLKGNPLTAPFTAIVTTGIVTNEIYPKETGRKHETQAGADAGESIPGSDPQPGAASEGVPGIKLESKLGPSQNMSQTQSLPDRLESDSGSEDPTSKAAPPESESGSVPGSESGNGSEDPTLASNPAPPDSEPESGSDAGPKSDSVPGSESGNGFEDPRAESESSSFVEIIATGGLGLLEKSGDVLKLVRKRLENVSGNNSQQADAEQVDAEAEQQGEQEPQQQVEHAAGDMPEVEHEQLVEHVVEAQPLVGGELEQLVEHKGEAALQVEVEHAAEAQPLVGVVPEVEQQVGTKPKAEAEPLVWNVPEAEPQSQIDPDAAEAGPQVEVMENPQLEDLNGPIDTGSPLRGPLLGGESGLQVDAEQGPEAEQQKARQDERQNEDESAQQEQHEQDDQQQNEDRQDHDDEQSSGQPKNDEREQNQNDQRGFRLPFPPPDPDDPGGGSWIEGVGNLAKIPKKYIAFWKQLSAILAVVFALSTWTDKFLDLCRQNMINPTKLLDDPTESLSEVINVVKQPINGVISHWVNKFKRVIASICNQVMGGVHVPATTTNSLLFYFVRRWLIPSILTSLGLPIASLGQFERKHLSEIYQNLRERLNVQDETNSGGPSLVSILQNLMDGNNTKGLNDLSRWIGNVEIPAAPAYAGVIVERILEFPTIDRHIGEKIEAIFVSVYATFSQFSVNQKTGTTVCSLVALYCSVPEIAKHVRPRLVEDMVIWMCAGLYAHKMKATNKVNLSHLLLLSSILRNTATAFGPSIMGTLLSVLPLTLDIANSYVREIMYAFSTGVFYTVYGPPKNQQMLHSMDPRDGVNWVIRHRGVKRKKQKSLLRAAGNILFAKVNPVNIVRLMWSSPSWTIAIIVWLVKRNTSGITGQLLQAAFSL
eukprot:687398-Rhodomonas_salina.2